MPDPERSKRKPDIAEMIFIAVSLAMVLYHMTSTQYLMFTTNEHLTMHVGFALLVIFLSKVSPAKTNMNRAILIAACIGVIVVWVYIMANALALVERHGFNTTVDLVIGVLLVLLFLSAAWQAMGPFIPCLVLFFIFYPFIGVHLPEPFTTGVMGPADTISNLGISLSTGVYQIINVSPQYIFLFVVFGGLLSGTGGIQFFLDIGKLAGGRLRAGPGLMAVIASCLVGSLSGSVPANITITGAFTIPLMKKVGYKPEQAAAIEAMASQGGSLMPPVMGSIAFVMAAFTGIPYLRIVIMAVLPALTYYLAGATYVYLRGEMFKLPKSEEKIDAKELLKTAPNFLGPFGIIIILLIMGFSVAYTAFWAIIGTCVILLLRKKTRPTIGQFIEGFVKGARAGAGIASVVGCLGIVIYTFDMTGLGIKASAGIMAWSGGSLVVAMIIIAAICILMGMSGITFSAYIIVSIFGAAALMQMGLKLGVAHFFILLCCSFGGLTPPVALSAVLVAKMADAKYMRTALELVKIAATAYLLPFMIIFVPMLIWEPQEPLQGILGIISCLVIATSSQVGLVGYLFTDLTLPQRVLVLLGAAALLAFTATYHYLYFGIGLGLLAVVVTWQKMMLPPAAEPIHAVD